MNPDGLAAVTRQNANGKDLNQNFPTYLHINKNTSDLKVYCILSFPFGDDVAHQGDVMAHWDDGLAHWGCA